MTLNRNSIGEKVLECQNAPNHLSLCTGIGGIDLAAEWAGFQTVGQCEFAAYPRKVLEKHWPDVPRWRDVRDVTAESVLHAGIGRIDLLSAGYPCQPFSLAGERGGEKDDRHLWPEVFRIVKELRPRWCLFENVDGHVSLGLDTVLSQLEGAGYTWGALVIPAAAVGERHRRDRVFIVAYTDSFGDNGEEEHRDHGDGAEEVHRRQSQHRLSYDGEVTATGRTSGCAAESRVGRVFDGFSAQLDGDLRLWLSWLSEGGKHPLVFREMIEQGLMQWPAYMGQEQHWWEPSRVAAGVPNRVDRIKTLGNAVSPQQVLPILKAIHDVDRAWTCNKSKHEQESGSVDDDRM